MLMQFQSSNGQMPGKAAGSPNAPGDQFGAGLFTEFLPRYYQLAKFGKVFQVGVANAAALTAFTGGAAGTPLIGIYNPSNSGVDLVMLAARLGVRSSGTTAGAQGLNFFLASQGSTAPTGTATAARQLYSGSATGSSALCMVNTANTGAVASSKVLTSFNLGNVTTTAGVNVISLQEELAGFLTVAPGNYLAWGAYVAAAAGAFDADLIWAELAV